MNKKFISPIAIDLGAKNTGVYFAHYPAGSGLDVFKSPGIKTGKIYQLDNNSYTYLMVNRTDKRHQKRGYDRRQMAKRLFKLVWYKHFKLPWDKDIQQTISFLLNRRGFNFLTEQYSADILSKFPREAFGKLPDKLKQEIAESENGYDFANALTEWSNEGKDKIKPLFKSLNQEPQRIRKRLCYISKTEKLRKYCSTREKGENIPEEKKVNLSQLPRWVLGNWIESGIHGLPNNLSETKFDMVKYLNEKKPETAKKIIGSLPDLKEKNELKESDWNFNAEDFDMEDAKFYDSESESPNIQTHLHHLTFAIHKIYSELESGGRHRSKYFEEVKTVLERKNHTHSYLKKFCEQLQSGGFQGLNIENLSNLIGHISNLELKPLRKYFNHKMHKINGTNEEGDQWDEKRINRFFERWILSEWRVNSQKDKDKAERGNYNYKKLRKKWGKEKTRGIVDFWLKTNPNWTIPPYQNNNNRRPPKCQSFILNVSFLNKKYPNWQTWLSELKKLQPVKDYLGDYGEKLKKLKSGKRKNYFSDDHKGNLLTDSGRRSMAELNTRILQFIFDRVKDEDPLKLNEIYSHAKKIKQDANKTDEDAVRNVKKTKQELEKSLKKSNLPNELKGKPDYDRNDLFPNGTFLHLICKYFKQRQRARNGRIYIHPEYRFVKGRGYENTGRFDDKDHMLTYCNHKPRQKRYQMLEDLAGLLQVSSHKLKNIAEKQNRGTIDERLFNWLSSIDKLKANCDRASREQKERRGRLKLDIQTVFGLIYHRKQSESRPDKSIKKILKNSTVNDAYKLHSFCSRAKDLCLILTKSLCDDLAQQEWEKDLEKNPATGVYLLAQINNITFKERSGNASTCAVCGADNAFRMQIISTANGKDTTVKSQRLPAISTRVIDGAVMRVARIVGGAIADDKWERIEKELTDGNKVCVPIITESNRFEYEPSLKILKTNRDEKHQNSDLLKDKNDRIKEDSKKICPYTGDPLSEGDKDHIIPRSSQWGTLNDEANLIWASGKGNKEIKQNYEFSLAQLKPKYKEEQFGTNDDKEIEEWIIEKIGDGSGEDFKFGKYRSFINLEPEQQTAFRHALFLVGHPLREKVINAINNKNRSLVNGTQRYFAETLANKLYKKAKRIGKESLLSFDYFGVEAQCNSRGDGIHDLRKLYEECYPKMAEYAKSKDKKQKAYSHLIDAMLAFVITADAHRKDGGLKLKLDDFVRKEPYDKETGEINGLWECIQVHDDECNIRNLDRRKPNENFSSHRSFTRDTFYADHYLPVLMKQKDDSICIKIGFSLENSAAVETGTKAKDRKLLKNIVNLLPLCNEDTTLLSNQYDSWNDLFSAMKKIECFAKQLQKSSYCYLTVNKLKLHEYWTKNYNTKTGKQFESDSFVYKILSYKTEKFAISKPDDLNKGLKKNFTWKVYNKDIHLPVKEQWENCNEKWKEKEKLEWTFEEFLHWYFKSHTNGDHQKVRKVFSLPVLTNEGKLMMRRKSWSGDYIYQVMNDSDSRKPDNKPNVPIRKKDGSLGVKLATWAKSNNFVKLKSNEKYEVGEAIDPKKWYMVDKDKFTLPVQIDQLWYQIDNSTAPSIAIKLAKDGKEIKDAEFMEDPICQHGFRKKPAKKATKNTAEQSEKSPQKIRDEFFEDQIKQKKRGAIICYKGASYKKEMKKAFKTAKLVDQLE